MIVYPNAKINIGLKVLEKRKDGYHNLESHFIPLPWYDALEIIENKKPVKKKVQFTTTGLPIAGDPNTNLCLKAYRLLDLDFDLPPIKMHLHKEIPMGAGLGGGSSDGAFALKLLNDLFELNLNATALKKYAAQLGSDCPFFIQNKNSFVTGRGEKITNSLLDVSGMHIVVIYPSLHISTGEAYQNIQRTPIRHELKSLPTWTKKTWSKRIENDFEGYALERYPMLSSIKESLYQKGAIYAGMSGSGSAMFGLFETAPKLLPSWKKHIVFQAIL